MKRPVPTTTSTITAERQRTAYLCSFPVMIQRGAVCTNCHRAIPKSKGMTPLPTDQPDAWHERYCVDCDGDPKTNGRTTKQQSRAMKRKNADSQTEPERTERTERTEPATTRALMQDAPSDHAGRATNTNTNDQLTFAFS